MEVALQVKQCRHINKETNLAPLVVECRCQEKEHTIVRNAMQDEDRQPRKHTAANIDFGQKRDFSEKERTF